ncbi:MAG: NAD-dependent epimerase/dehydratase family protein [Spirochaetales bacterium]|nr:NAD-dependent epimerase/dehydratase family protein [Spirochaetales bacterium]
MSRKALFLGGTGNLSRDAALRALDEGWELWLANRGTSNRDVAGARTLSVDARDSDALRQALKDGAWDSVVDFISYQPAHVRAVLGALGNVGQYVFISSASCYHKPPLGGPIREDTPLANPFWAYSRDKIRCEEALNAYARAPGSVPVTVVRPSHTYGETWIPSIFGSASFAAAARLLAGKPMLVHGDGTARWTLTHARDFAVGLVGVMGNNGAHGQAVHITGDSAPTWTDIYRTLGRLLGAEASFAFVPADFIAEQDPGFAERLLGDKGWDTVFDNTKLKALVPGFSSSVTLEQGLAESLAYYRAHPELMVGDPGLDVRLDAVIAAWRSALARG